jgi:hypothetical protein
MKRLFQLTNLEILRSVQLPVERAHRSWISPTDRLDYEDVYLITVSSDIAEEVEALAECGFGHYLV